MIQAHHQTPTVAQQTHAVQQALQIIPPLWELNSYVAVNPFLGRTNQTFFQALAELEGKWGTSLFPDQATLHNTPIEISGENLDLGPNSAPQILGSFLAAYYDQGAAVLPTPFHNMSLWQAWKFWIQHGPSISKINPVGLGLHEDLPWHQNLNLSSDEIVELLELIPGWSSYLRKREWPKEASLQGDLSTLAYILALLDQTLPHGLERPPVFQSQKQEDKFLEIQKQEDKLFQKLKPKLTQKGTASNSEVLMVFCIDVRSEPLRRHLEKDSRIETAGFAGFFGQFVSSKESSAKHSQDHCPILVKPSTTMEIPSQAGKPAKSWLLNSKRSAPLGFGFVEVAGWLGLGDLWKARKVHHSKGGASKLVQYQGQALESLHAQWDSWTPEQKTDHAYVLIRHLGMHHPNFQWKKWILLMGHGSHNQNNPHKAGLACGACGGQSGELSARMAAYLLNDQEVRGLLLQRGINIPETTRFCGGLHETVTDEMIFFPQSAQDEHELEAYSKTWKSSTQKACQERSKNLGLESQLALSRSEDPAEILPEAGLAGNAFFLAMKRDRLREVDLEGRAFLNNYDAALDEDFATLELILSAPMVVANWINLQYYASTVSPSRLGAGNKLMHSIVGNFGVLEGLGHDLRVGLPLQSVYDGEKFFHQPVRLQAVIEAMPQDIENILNKHPQLKELCSNQWLILRALEPNGSNIWKWTPEGFIADN